MEQVTKTKKFKTIYETLLPNIKKINSTYFFLPTKIKNSLEEEVQNILLEIYNKNSNKEKNIEFYIEMYKLYIDEYIKRIIENPKYSNEIISNYIKGTLSIQKNFETNVKQLIKFIDFTEIYEFNLTPDACIEILKTNEGLTDIIKQIVNKYLKEPSKKNKEMLSNNEIIMMLIDIYCKKENIPNKILDDSENRDDIYNELDMPDSVKQYLSEIPSKILTPEEEKELAKQKDEGNKVAREKLIEYNLKFVVTIAKKNTGRGLDILELIQEGNIGLITAVDKFDYKKGFRILSYAEWWIKQSITKAIYDKGRMIRLPIHQEEKKLKYKKVKEQLWGKLNREPTPKEIANELNMTIEEIETIQKNEFILISLNERINGNEDNEELLYFLPSDEESLEDIYIKKEVTSEIITILKKCRLKEREIQIVLLRNGFYGRNKTQEEVGKIFGITRERVRQIENKVLKQIRLSPYTKELIEYMTNPKEASKNLEIYKKYYHYFYNSNSKSIQTSSRVKEMKEIVEYIEYIELYVKTNNIFPTIYEIFKQYGYTKEQIKLIISKLSNTDKNRIKINNSIVNDLNFESKDISEYIRITLPKIRMLLRNKYPNIEEKKYSNQQEPGVNIRKLIPTK